MDTWKSHFDPGRLRAHYADRMHRILEVCQGHDLLWHHERVTFRDGAVATQRVNDIVPAKKVVVTQQHERYGLRISPRVLPRLQGMGPQFAHALDVPMTQIEVEEDIVYVWVPRGTGASAPTVAFEDVWRIHSDMPCGSVLLGIDDDHRQLVLDLVAPANAHVAVLGMTGTGKSNLMRGMALSALLSRGARVALFDPSGGLGPLSGHPAVWRGGLFAAADECLRGLQSLADSLARPREGLILVFVDEVPDLITRRPEIRDLLALIAQAGQRAGIHLVLSASHIPAEAAGSRLFEHIPVRLVSRMADRTAAYEATGRADSGAEQLRGRGEFVAVSGGVMRHFAAAWVSASFLAGWRRRYPPRAPLRPPRTPAPAAARPCAPLPDRLCATSGGRPADEIPPEVVCGIAQYVAEHGSPPSSNWIYRFTKALVPSGGYNRNKARRAVGLALAGPWPSLAAPRTPALGPESAASDVP